MNTAATAQRQGDNVEPLCIHLHSRFQSTPTISEVFAQSPETLDELRRVLNPSSDTGALLLISSRAGQGKTTVTNLVLNHVFDQQSNDDPIPVLHVGLQEYHMPEGTAPRFKEDSQTCLGDDTRMERFIVIDEVRTRGMAFEALALAAAGAKVIAILHADTAQQAIQRLRALVDGFGIGEIYLHNIIKSGLLVSIHQELVSDESIS